MKDEYSVEGESTGKFRMLRKSMAYVQRTTSPWYGES